MSDVGISDVARAGQMPVLVAQTDDLEEKRRCLHAILELDPDNEPAFLALLPFDQRRPTS